MSVEWKWRLLEFDAVGRAGKGGWGGGGGGEERRNSDGPTSGLAILTCKGRLFTHIFPRTVLVFFLLFLLLFFSFLNNSYIGRFSVRKRNKGPWQYAKYRM